MASPIRTGTLAAFATGSRGYRGGPSTSMCAPARRRWAQVLEAGPLPARTSHVFHWMSSFDLFLLNFFVRRTCSAGQVLRLYTVDIKLGYTLSHCLKHIFQGWRVAVY